LFTGEGIQHGTSLAGWSYRRALRAEVFGQPAPRIRTLGTARRLSVIYTPYDVSTSLLGTAVFGLRGFDAPTSLKFMRNAVLYANLTSAQKSKLGKE
jgi:hypothetical protein